MHTENKKLPTSEATTALKLESGYQIETMKHSQGEKLLLKTPSGQICLKISLLPEGPQVELQSTNLSIATQGKLEIDCESFKVNARQEISLQSEQNISYHAQEIRANAAAKMETTAFEQKIRATHGDVAIVANDDVKIDGERVKLNCPQGKKEH